MLGRSDQPVATPPGASYAARMSEQSPASGPITDGPADPEHDSTAAYGLDRSYVAALTRRVVSTSGETHAVSSPIGGTPLAHVPQSSPADVAEAFARARQAQVVVGRHVHRPARRRPPAPARPAARPPGRAHRPRRVGVGQGPQGRLPRGGPPRADRALLRPHRARAPRHPARRRDVPGADPGRGATACPRASSASSRPGTTRSPWRCATASPPCSPATRSSPSPTPRPC